jgi:hypothetical protein
MTSSRMNLVSPAWAFIRTGAMRVLDFISGQLGPHLTPIARDGGRGSASKIFPE